MKNRCTKDIADEVGKKLIERKITISSAESITGGMFAARLTDIPGISEVFMRGLVTYTNEAKMDLLGVKKETLDRHTAVSRETADEMVEGLAENAGTDICIAVTGIAGPGGGTPDKPVGLFFVAVKYKNRKTVKEMRSENCDRRYNRNYAMMCMFDMINRVIDEEEI